LPDSLSIADRVWVYESSGLGLDMSGLFSGLDAISVATDTEEIVAAVAAAALPGDAIVVMSNGGFDGIHGRLKAALEEKF
jgi:UDP-N-acetylmuramate: L-alanyl-gamma-D-glutamyl-meso-diaminopimelate ligase